MLPITDEKTARRASVALALILLALFLVAAANAATLSVSWTNPTTNTDGSAIPATGDGRLTSTRVEYGSCAAGGAFGTKAGETVVNQPATSAQLTVGPGTYCVRAYARNSYGVESAASVVASKTIDAPTPNPPTFVTLATVAYELRSHPVDGVRLGRAVGTVPIGVACGPDAIVYAAWSRAYHEVALDVVTLDRMPRSAIVVAECGPA